MTAKDYKVCISGLTSTPYFAKTDKQYSVMTGDKREITHSEILMLIDCYMSNKCEEEEYKDGIVCFKSHIQEGKIIEIQIKDKSQDDDTDKD